MCRCETCRFYANRERDTALDRLKVPNIAQWSAHMWATQGGATRHEFWPPTLIIESLDDFRYEETDDHDRADGNTVCR